MIRQARPEDRFDIAKLVYMVWDDMELELVKHLPKDMVLDAIEKAVLMQYIELLSACFSL